MQKESQGNEMIRMFWLTFNFLIGCALGGLIMAGFLGFNTLVPIAVAGILVGLLHGVLWWLVLRWKDNGNLRQFRIGRTSLIAFQVLIAFLLTSLFLIQRYQFTNQPQLQQDRVAEFERLWLAIDKAYPYFEDKGINWAAVREKYRSEIQNVENDEAYFALVASMLGELNDAHSHLNDPPVGEMAFGTVIDKGGLAVIDLIGRSGEAAGVEKGMVIVSVEGVEVEQAIQNVDLTTKNAATPWARRIQAMNNLLMIPEDESLRLGVIDQTGTFKELEIQLLPANTQSTQVQEQYESVPTIHWERLPENLGYIQVNRLRNLEGENLIEAFDAALNELMDTDGMILDLRENGGGNSMLGDQIVSRFLTEPFTYGYEEYPVRLYQHIWRAKTFYQVQPRGETYTKPLVVLIDYEIMSSAEMMLAALVDSGRAFTIGQPTGGSSGNPIHFKLIGGDVQYSTGAFYRMNGELLEGNGFQPDITVEWAVEEYINGIDPDLQNARDWLLGQ